VKRIEVDCLVQLQVVAIHSIKVSEQPHFDMELLHAACKLIEDYIREIVVVAGEKSADLIG
jgi:hypothetical protein